MPFSFTFLQVLLIAVRLVNPPPSLQEVKRQALLPGLVPSREVVNALNLKQ